MDEQGLISECLKGNVQAQKALFDRYSGKVMGVCLRYLREEEEANDQLQESFIRIFNGLSEYRGDAPLGAWITRITVNTCLEFLRKHNKVRMTEWKEEVTEKQVFAENPSENLDRKDLLNMIRSLAPGYRAVFNLFAIEGYSHKEIALMLGISEGTSKSQYARARAELQKMISLDRINS